MSIVARMRSFNAQLLGSHLLVATLTSSCLLLRIFKVPIDCAIALTGRYLASGVVDGSYRIAQESLSNVAKHAEAGAVFLSLVEGQRQSTLSVTDDGHGFAPTDPAGGGHFGLVGMQERARAVGGTLVIERDMQQGTTVRLTVPLRWNEDGES